MNFKGNEYSKIFNNIQLLSKCIEKSEKNLRVIKTLEAFRDFHFSFCGLELCRNWQEVNTNSELNKRLMTRKYWIKNVESLKHGKKYSEE